MEYYIQTEKSYFGKIPMNMDELLAECVQEIEGQLIIKPAIVIYGKTVNQQIPEKYGLWAEIFKKNLHTKYQLKRK